MRVTKYVVTGGTPLRGEVHLHGAKNAGFKAMIASLLADSPSTICDLGLISEIDFAKQVITQLGGKITPQSNPHCLEIDPTNLNSFSVAKEIGEKSRASNLYAPSLLHRFGKVSLPVPGGDQIGRRPLERHFAGLEAMGAKITIAQNEIRIETPNGLTGTNFHFAKNTHTGTEFLVMAAAWAKGETILSNAAAEPEVDDLIKFLNSMGGNIKRVAERTIRIFGVEHFHGAKHTVMRDRNEAVTFACASLVTNGDIKIIGADPTVLQILLQKVEEAGGRYEIGENFIQFSLKGALKPTKIVATPYPGFMTDWQPLWSTIMTQADGESIVHETIYEKRFDYVPNLIKMGAKIDFFEPDIKNPDEIYNFNLSDDTHGNKHAIKIYGKTSLKGVEVEISDIRSGATALLAGVTADGQTTVIDPKDQIKRGYECLPEQLVSLGAKII
ncbi:MAG: UDP-N-acetylglucosamine 1-carboxyvinyltransferase [Patescibacteria group bacterium]|nr:UDP-N-acetylglucosamine 1-carboxyvinyltransferase [Patescibacteria group bacterium]MCL5431733.1 UDP-N-acetylglucosamine 1-carboxyvinyltransferase [Patescibacteria group bacterium]